MFEHLVVLSILVYITTTMVFILRDLWSVSSPASFYLLFGVGYILVSLAVRIAHAIVFNFFDGDVTVSWPDGGPQ